MIDDDDEIDTMDALDTMEASDLDTADLGGLDHDFSATGSFGAQDEEEEMEAEASVGPAAKPDMNLIMDIPVTMQVVLGKAVMPVANLVKLSRGAVVKLDTNIGDPVDLIVNGRIVARGEVVVLENEESRFGITLTEIVSPGAKPQRSKTAGA